MLNKNDKGLVPFTVGLVLVLIALVLAFIPRPADAMPVDEPEQQEVIVTQAELCNKLEDMIQGNSMFLRVNYEDAKLNIFDEAVYGEMREMTMEMHAVTLKAIATVEVEQRLLKEMYIDACENQ